MFGKIFKWVITHRTVIGGVINVVATVLGAKGKVAEAGIIGSVGSYVMGSGAHDSDAVKRDELATQ